MSAPLRCYHPNTGTYLPIPDYRTELVRSLTKIVHTAPPCLPWKDSFKSTPIGFWTGPTSIAYLFLWLSQTHSDLRIDGVSASEHCEAYLACEQESVTLEARGSDELGLKNEYLAFSAVQASHLASNSEIEKALLYVNRLVEGVTALNDKADLKANELLSGRAGALVFLRIVEKFVPGAANKVSSIKAALTDKILSNDTPWQFGGHEYLGAAHGSIGIITQLILSDPSKNTKRVEDRLHRLLDLQQQDSGAWPVTPEHDLGLVQFCHGSPGFVISLLAIRKHCSPDLQRCIDTAVHKGKRDIWDHGYLKKEPNLCHGVIGNALALEAEQREQFMALATARRIETGLVDGTFEKGDDPVGLQWGEAGKAWAWMAMDLLGRGKDIGFPGYTEV